MNAYHSLQDSSTPPAQPREALVRLAINDLSAALDGLQMQVDEMETRLVPVLSVTPRLAAGTGAKEGPRPAFPPLVESLHEAVGRVHALSRRIREIADRVEL